MIMELPYLYLVLLFVVGAQALNIRNPDDSPGFSLSVSKTEKARRNFVQDWAAVRQKWGNGVPDSVSSAFSLADANGRVDVHPMGSDDIFIADVEIGEPPQVLKMALDTGSSDVWMQSTDTAYTINRQGPWAPQYHPKDSKSANLMKNSSWNVQYLDGTAAHGIVYRDTIRLGGFEIHNATVQSAQMVTSRFETETSLSGIMGLAKTLPNNIEPPTPSFLNLLKPLLKEPVFTVDLRKNATGQFDFGFVNNSLALDNMTWIDSDPKSPHWDVELDLTSWTGNGRTWWYHKFTATIDTGTTMMFMPDALASMYWFDVPGMKSDIQFGSVYTFPCSGAKDLPDLMFKLPGTEHVIRIPGPYMNYGPVEGDDVYCWGGMQSATGLDVVVLGDVMLKALLVGFDLENNRVGFANKKV